jgi:23S rRNA-/tRNA-specific pseudouridylate synthase
VQLARPRLEQADAHAQPQQQQRNRQAESPLGYEARAKGLEHDEPRVTQRAAPTPTLVLALARVKETVHRREAMELLTHDILYEDEWLLVLAKPAGLLQRDGHIGYLGLQHRLDVETSGLLVFARREDANRPLSQAFAERRTEKVYLAVTARPGTLPQQPWSVRDHLAPNKRGHPPMVSVRSGGDPAWTDFVLRDVAERALLIEARLHTGRRHQIRVHLSGLGMAILGDRDYGPATASLAPRVLLHAWKLALAHPHTGAALAWRCPPPLDFRTAALHLGLAVPE